MPDHIFLPNSYSRSYTVTPSFSGTQVTRHKTISGSTQKLYTIVRINKITESTKSRLRAKLKQGFRPN
jgi:hypothetical protein